MVWFASNHPTTRSHHSKFVPFTPDTRTKYSQAVRRVPGRCCWIPAGRHVIFRCCHEELLHMVGSLGVYCFRDP